MTEAELNQYRAIKDEIKLLGIKILDLNKIDVKTVADKVEGSSNHFPYNKVNFCISGKDADSYDKNQEKINNLKLKRERKRAELIEKETEMFDFIYSIPDSQSRQIFILRYMDGLTQMQISRKVHLDQSAVSRKLKTYLD